ncbi:protein phosphatase 1 regulatory subunit 15B [Aulostomus maculatus]
MLRNNCNERLFLGGQSSSSPPGLGVASPRLESQENTGIGLLSGVFRPSRSFCQKCVSSLTRNADFPDILADNQTELVQHMENLLRTKHNASHVTYLRCQQPRRGVTLSWMTADSLRETGIYPQSKMGYAKAVLSCVGLSLLSGQDIHPAGEKGWVQAVSSSRAAGAGKSLSWRDDFFGGEPRLLKCPFSELRWNEGRMVSACLCPQQPVAVTNVPDTETTGVFVLSSSTELTLGENTGPTRHKEEPANNGCLQIVENTEGSTPDHQLRVSSHPSSSGAAAACGEVALLVPEQDSGYSSLEEEHLQICHLYVVKALSEEQRATESSGNRSAVQAEMEEDASEEAESSSVDEEDDEEGTSSLRVQSAEVTELNPHCRNKAIAFIMGCPCSDDEDSSQLDRESSDDDDDEGDDGFDSEGLSDPSDSSDEDDEDDEEDSDSDLDSLVVLERERLWNSLSRSQDPYNPQNFTAQLHTGSTPPRTIPTPSPPSSTQSTPSSSPDVTPLPLSSLVLFQSLSSSSPPSHDIWDDSTSASEVDEAESLHLLSSFSSSDPYSLFNFQASLRTKEPIEAAPRAKPMARKASQAPPRPPHPKAAASPPKYRREEAEERFDSGFCEPGPPSGSSTTKSSSSATKKVRFCDDVEEFFTSSGEEEEDRRGPWEELARDRCRFLRRCQEVEDSIAYCLQPPHRSLVYRRLMDAEAGGS